MAIISVFLIMLVCVLFCYIIGDEKGKKAANSREVRECEKECDTSHNAYRASRLIAQFIKPRSWVCRTDVCYAKITRDENVERVWLYNHMNMPYKWEKDGVGINECTFIRLCHYLGCEVIIRQVGSADKEDESMHDQVKTYMSEHLRRENISYVYPHNKKVGEEILIG